MSEQVNYVRHGNSGICFAHGPYFDPNGRGCPKHPECAEVIARDGANPEYISLAFKSHLLEEAIDRLRAATPSNILPRCNS